MKSPADLPRILVYQDENCAMLAEYLQCYGFYVTTSTEVDVVQKIKEHNYDLCILDHYKTGLPGDLRLLAMLRKDDDKVPIIFVSGHAGYDYIIAAFDAGVDDYIIRPYNLEELVRRVKAVLKRCGVRTRTIKESYQIGSYIFNTGEGILRRAGAETKLTGKESKILALLCAYENEVLPKKVLMQNVWAEDNYFNKRSLDVHMCNLRNCLKADKRVSIETRRGLGYSLMVKELL